MHPDSYRYLQRPGLSRRRLLRASLIPVWAGLVAACAPARNLTSPSAGGRTQVTPVVTQTPDATGNQVVANTGGRTATSSPAPVSVQSPTPPRPVPSPLPSPSPTATAGPAAAAAGQRAYQVRPAAAGSVRFLHGWDGPVRTHVEAMVAELEPIIPGVEIESEAVEPAALHDTLITALASGSPPNAVMLRSDSAPYFADAGMLLPLDPLLERDGVRREWFKPRELTTRTWDGQLYGLPHVAVGAEQLLYINLALLERLGHDPGAPITTWEQVQALAEPARRLGALALDPTRCSASVLGLRVWSYAAGGRWLDDGGRTVTWAEPPIIAAAEWMQQLVAAQRGETSLPEIANAGAGPLSGPEFALQRHVCCVQDASWGARLIQEAPQLRVGVYEAPGPESVPAEQRRTPSFGGWMLAIPRASRDQAAAWEWLKYVSVGDGAEQLAEALGRPSALTRPPGSAPPGRAPVSPVALEAQGRSVVVPATPIAARLDDLARDTQARLLSQRQTPRSLLEAASQEAQQLLDAWHARRRRG